MVPSKMLIALAAALPFAAAADSCNPLKSTSCPADTALGKDISDSFNSESDNYSVMAYPSGVTYGDNGLELTLAKRLDNPSIVSNFYIMFGRTEVHLKAASGKGIISSFYLQSDDLDEIDIEFFGTDTTQVQSNFFSKGDTTKYDRGGYHNIGAPPQADFHNYTLDWTEDYVKWYYDGILLRTLSSNDPEGFPQTPMRIYAGIWAGGDPSNAPGTIEWAGGETDYSQAPFVMGINKLLVSDYSSGTKYTYSDQSGLWQSIKSDGGSVNGRIGDVKEAVVSSASASGSSTSTSSTSTSSTSTSTSSSSTSASSATSATSTTSSSSSSSSSSASSSTATTSSVTSATSSVTSTGSTSLQTGTTSTSAATPATSAATPATSAATSATSAATPATSATSSIDGTSSAGAKATSAAGSASATAKVTGTGLSSSLAAEATTLTTAITSASDIHESATSATHTVSSANIGASTAVNSFFALALVGLAMI